MNRQQQSNKSYKELALGDNGLTRTAGRLAGMENLEELIFQEIIIKLDLKACLDFLDVGCGFGQLTKLLLQHSIQHQIKTTLIDITEILGKLASEFPELVHNCVLHSGNFPYETPQISMYKKYDRILAYSVLHYVANPYEFLDKLVHHLKPGGLLLVGDIPTANKKGRFLSSKYGRTFEANYKKVKIEQTIQYKSHHDFVVNMPNLNLHLTDSFLLEAFMKYRNAGCEVYILKQDERLPFGYTREDLLIQKNWE